MESTAQQTSEGRAVVAVLAAVLERLVNSNTQVPNGENITKFHAFKAPAISIHQYLERVSNSDGIVYEAKFPDKKKQFCRTFLNSDIANL